MQKDVLVKVLEELNFRLREVEAENDILYNELSLMQRNKLPETSVEFQKHLIKIKENQLKMFELTKKGKPILDEYEQKEKDELFIVSQRLKLSNLLRQIELLRMKYQGYDKVTIV